MKLDITKPIKEVIDTDAQEAKKPILLYPKQKFIKNPVMLKMVLVEEQTGLTLANVAMHSNLHINDVVNEALTLYARQFQ